MEKNEVLQRFVELYGGDAESVRLYHSPGRVNLIGEHTDYNGGYVFPCALSFGTYGAARARKDKTVRLASANFDLTIDTSLDNIIYNADDGWGNLPKGVIKEIQNLGFADKISGVDIFVAGNIPNGAGLSSSASVELLIFAIFDDLFSLGIDRVQMAKLSQKAENEFVGVNCGIMDQFIIAMGKKDCAVLLDCMRMTYEYVPVILDGYKIIIANTNKQRGLTDSKYNERRAECERAVSYLQKELDIAYLADISTKTFESYKHLIEDETVRKRAEHVVYENERALLAVDQLKSNDIEAFGQLMIQSHNSLRDLYEVTGIELDTLVSEALKLDGTVGSRMTGAGFGGCTVSIVENAFVSTFIETVGSNYYKKTGLNADFFIADIGGGTQKL